MPFLHIYTKKMTSLSYYNNLLLVSSTICAARAAATGNGGVPYKTKNNKWMAFIVMVLCSICLLSTSVVQEADAQLDNIDLSKFTSGPAVFDWATRAPTAPTPRPTTQCLLTDVVDPMVLASKPICGGANLETGKVEKPCNVRTDAIYQGKANPKQYASCPSGSFYDLIGGCYQCPSPRTVRSEFPVNGGMACQNNDQSLWTYTKAKKEFNLRECPRGFFDLIHGGSCWECPASHPLRTGEAVDSSKACTKSVWTILSLNNADFARANYIQASHTDCGSFVFDVIDGGSCWTCGDYAARTVYPVNGDKACENRYFGPAKLVAQMGCPPGQFWDMIDGGTCWSCPVSFERSLFSVKSDQACFNNQLMWNSTRAIPGMFNIRVVTDKLREIVLGDPTIFYDLAVAHIKNLKNSDLEPSAEALKHFIDTLDTAAPNSKPHPLLVTVLTQILLKEISTESCFSKWFRKYYKNSRIFVANEANRMLDSYNQGYLSTLNPDYRAVMLRAWTGKITTIPNFMSIAESNYNSFTEMSVLVQHAVFVPATNSILIGTEFARLGMGFYNFFKGWKWASEHFGYTTIWGIEFEVHKAIRSAGAAVKATKWFIVLVIVEMVLEIGLAILQIVVADKMVNSIRSALDEAKATEITAAYAAERIKNTVSGPHQFAFEFAHAVNAPSTMPDDIKTGLTIMKQKLLVAFTGNSGPALPQLRLRIKQQLEEQQNMLSGDGPDS